jgi:hypothetical protein
MRLRVDIRIRLRFLQEELMRLRPRGRGTGHWFRSWNAQAGSGAHAQSDFEMVRKIDPGNRVVLHGEGMLSMNSGDLETALTSSAAH